MQRLHDFLHWRIRVQTVDLVEVNIIHAKALQRMIDFRHDVLAGGTATIGMAGAHVEVDFRRNDDFITIQTVLADKPSRNLFARAHLIDVGCIEVVDSQINGLLEDGLGILEVPCPRKHAVLAARLAETHHAQTDA